MLSLSNIELQTNGKRFSKKTKKFIRFSYKTNMSSSKQSSLFVNEATLKWSQPIVISEVFNQEIDFEIYDRHEFGYNPEELQTILYGSMRISHDQKIGKWTVYSTAEDHKKAGYLVTDIKRIIKPSARESTRSLTSILVRKIKEDIGKSYFVIKNNLKVIRTSQVSPISKELLFTEKYDLGKPKDSDNLIFQLYDAKDTSIARAMIQYRDCKSSNKIDLYDSERNEHFAELYFELEENFVNTSALNASNVKNPEASTFGKYRTMSESNLTRNKDYSTLFQTSNRKKRMSVLHSNGDVVFPKEERFQIYQDRQTNVISYSKLRSFQFLDSSKQYYRGASFGKGQKTDFTVPFKGNPGVGNYRLPSIFDRY